jgi:hypothetical protein
LSFLLRAGPVPAGDRARIQVRSSQSRAFSGDRLRRQGPGLRGRFCVGLSGRLAYGALRMERSLGEGTFMDTGGNRQSRPRQIMSWMRISALRREGPDVSRVITASMEIAFFADADVAFTSRYYLPPPAHTPTQRLPTTLLFSCLHVAQNTERRRRIVLSQKQEE